MNHLSPAGVGTFRVSCMSLVTAGRVMEDLRAQGFGIYKIDAANASNKESLFQAMTDSFSLEASLGAALSSWDVLADLLWQKLMEQPSNRVAIFWNNADLMLNGRLELLLDALEVLQGVGAAAESQRKDEVCHPVLVRVVLVGNGPNFTDTR